MNFKKHSEVEEGSHAFCSPSQHHWLNYSDEKLVERWRTHDATEKGTVLHDLARRNIEMRRKQKGRDTFAMYVNDAIGFGMSPEVVLYYSPFFFGTADAIHFNEKKGFLRIHDLKTGVTPASMKQLYIYDALFCLDYDIKPGDIEIENRIYQLNEIIVENPTVEVVVPIIDKIITFDKILTDIVLEDEPS